MSLGSILVHLKHVPLMSETRCFCIRDWNFCVSKYAFELMGTLFLSFFFLVWFVCLDLKVAMLVSFFPLMPQGIYCQMPFWLLTKRITSNNKDKESVAIVIRLDKISISKSHNGNLINNSSVLIYISAL